MLKRCSLCRRLRLRRSFRWEDTAGQQGESRRCRGCRRRGKQRNPALPPVERYWLKPHAVHRYIERCRPELSYARARDEMIIRMEGAMFVAPHEAPDWCRRPMYLGPRPRHLGFLLIDEDTAFAVARYRTHRVGEEYEKVSTVLTRKLSAESRAA